jgi:hypothetical protein
VSEEQKAAEAEDQKKMGNDGDDVEAHQKSGGGFPRADDDDGDDVEAHYKPGGNL